MFTLIATLCAVSSLFVSWDGIFLADLDKSSRWVFLVIGTIILDLMLVELLIFIQGWK